MDPVAFGCLLEKAGASPAAPYRCGAAAQPPGDPCTATDNPYYDGPAFPEALVAKVPGAESIVIEWEHAALRHVMVVFKPEITKEAILAAFPVPPRGGNVQDAGVVSCTNPMKKQLCLSLAGFDHMGAADVECPECPE